MQTILCINLIKYGSDSQAAVHNTRSLRRPKICFYNLSLSGCLHLSPVTDSAYVPRWQVLWWQLLFLGIYYKHLFSSYYFLFLREYKGDEGYDAFRSNAVQGKVEFISQCRISPNFQIYSLGHYASISLTIGILVLLFPLSSSSFLYPLLYIFSPIEMAITQNRKVVC